MYEINGETFLDSSEAARIIGIHPASLRHWRSDRRGEQPPYMKVGGLIWYRKADVEAFASTYVNRLAS